MRLKSFSAKTMKDALTMIRETLGEDAIIVSTRDDGARGVRVTAAVDKDAEEKMPRPLGDIMFDDWQYEDDDDAATVVEDVTDIMLRHAAPDSVLERVVAAVNIMGLTDTRTALRAALQSIFQFRPLPAADLGRPVLLVGPPGSGKTLTAAKIAARGALSGKKIGVITTDTVRAGGIEQLEAFTRLMKIDLKCAATPKELKSCLDSMGPVDRVIIDTAGVNPFDPESIKPLARLIHAAETDPIMVMPAGLDADEAGETARVFATIGAASIIPTRVDTARRVGSLLSAALQGDLAFAEMSSTPKVADGLAPMSASLLTDHLMPRLKDQQQPSTQIKKAG